MRTSAPRGLLLPAVLAAPGLLLGVAGLFHPHVFGYDTSLTWFRLHLVGLVGFPLLGLALAYLVRGRNDPLAWLVRVTAYVYATFYTALDVIAGIANGYVTHELGPGVERPRAVSLAFHIGDELGPIGAWGLIGCGLALLVDQVRRHGALAGLPAALVPLGGWLVKEDHIFAPTGVAGMVLIGVATGLLARNLPPIRAGSQATS